MICPHCKVEHQWVDVRTDPPKYQTVTVEICDAMATDHMPHLIAAGSRFICSPYLMVGDLVSAVQAAKGERG